MIFKIIAMHPYGYFQVHWNIFDCLVVFIGLADLFLVFNSGLPIFLILRLVSRIQDINYIYKYLSHFLRHKSESFVYEESLKELMKYSY